MVRDYSVDRQENVVICRISFLSQPKPIRTARVGHFAEWRVIPHIDQQMISAHNRPEKAKRSQLVGSQSTRAVVVAMQAILVANT